jgi:hypothetical protein
MVLLDKIKGIHGDKYDYSLFEYVNYRTKVKIICPEHGIFEQLLGTHLQGKGCPKCSGKNRNVNDIIKLMNEKHKNKYFYPEFVTTRVVDKINIICPKHGEFNQQIREHLKGQGCPKCAIENRNKEKVLDKNIFIDRANEKHDNKYDYSLVEYSTIKDDIKIICPTHGEFQQRASVHIIGDGCIKCSNNSISKSEIKLQDFIDLFNIKMDINNREILDGQELDIYIPSHNVAIEFNGLYWHNELYKDKNYHLNKTVECEKKGIQLIHIFEDEWLYKQDIVKSRVKNILGLTENRIYARKCVIKDVSSKESKEFLNKNHIQGNINNSNVRIGLYYNNELVSLMTFGSLRKSMGSVSVDGSYELYRFCNKLDSSVIGGADKLLKYFIKVYRPNKVISYADRRWSQGDLYEKLGFKFIANSKPNYFYVLNHKREGRFNYRKDILIKEGFDKDKSEHQIMLGREIYRIYDCGAKKYELGI